MAITSPTSFQPGDLSQPNQTSAHRRPEMVPAQDDNKEFTKPYNDDNTPVLTVFF